MSFSTKYDWFFLEKDDPDQLQAAKQAVHQIVQCVAAVGRTFSNSSEREEDENAKLSWVPGLWRMAGTWVEGNSEFRSSVSLKDQKLYLVDPRLNTLDELKLVGQTYNDLMLWVEQQIIDHNLSTAKISTEFPYSLPEYARDFRAPYEESTLKHSEILGGHYHDAFILFQSFTGLSESTSEIHIYPHHFDLEKKITLKNTGDLSTDTFVRLGFSPGDPDNKSPYLYINGWPQVTGEKLPKAPLEGFWVMNEWYGLVLSFDVIYGRDDQAEYMHQFLQEGLEIFKSLLLG